LTKEKEIAMPTAEHLIAPASRRLVACLLGLVLVGLLSASAALADNVVVTPTSVTLANAGGSTALTGTSISGYSDPTESLLTSVSTTIGSLSMSQTSGLTLSNGYSSFSGSTFSFTGNQADIQAGLATLSLSDSGTLGTASVAVTVTPNATGIEYLPATGHYYEYVPATNILWTSAKAAAAALSFDGQPGYLASIPNSTVNNFIQAHLNGAANVWAGGESTDYPSGYNGNSGIQRVWSWQDGPLAGTTFSECSNVSGGCSHTNDSGDYYDWNTGEPNNSGYSSSSPGSGEHYLEINYLGEGIWNDIPNSTTIAGYVAEFGNSAAGGGFTGVYSGTATITLATAPGAPTALTTDGDSVSGGQATIGWTAPVSNGGSLITGYTVTASPGGATCTTTGATSCTVTALSTSGSYTFRVTATNAEGTSSSSSASRSTTILTYPSAPAVTAPANNADTSNTRPTFSGTAEPSSVVTVLVDGSSIGTATADGSGTWTLTPSSAIPQNVHSFQATQTDTNGHTSSLSSSESLTIDTVAPAAPTVTAPANHTDTDDNTPTFSGAAEAYSLVTVKRGSTVIGTAAADGSGNWSFTPPTSILDGTYSLTATATDGAGNVSSPSSAESLTIDTAAPAAPTVTAPANHTDTNDNTPTFSGTAEPNSTVMVYIDGSAIGMATTDGSGNWSYTPSSPIADGTHTVTATATDAAGNASTGSGGQSLTIDTVAPAAPTVTAPANGSASNVVSPVVTFSGEPGASATVEVDGVDYGPVTLDGSGSGQFSIAGPLSPGQHSVRVRLTDAAGNIGDWSNPSIWTVKLSTTVHLTGPTSGPTNATTPTVHYASEAGDQYVITVDGQTAVTGVVPAGGTGSITLPTALPDGPNTILILATDAAGNTASDSIVVTIDTVSPDPVQVGAAPASITSRTAATFSFSETKPGVSFQCSLDGATWTTCTSPVTFSGLAGGPHTLLLRAVDDAGNISAGTQYAWTVQSTPPAPPAILGGPAAATTAHATVFNFSAPTGTTLECSVDGGTYAPCPAQLSMNSLSMGAHSLAVRAVDEAGNVSTPTVYNWDVLPRTGARGLPTTSTLLVAANVTVAGRRDLLVGCNLNAGSVRRCVVTLYHDGRRIGTGVASERGNGHTHAVVKVWLNARGRGLIALADGGLPVTVRGAAFPVAFGALRARTHTILYPPMRLIVNDVRFRLDSFRLTPDGRAGVAAIAAQLTGAQSIVCEGNTDRSDSYAGSYNLGLSRAAAVCGLLHRLGVKAQSRLVSFAYDRPIATNATPAGRALNRRVVVLVNYHDLPAGQQ
jgi:hypothetical protein